ncbi:MAG: hypothetical protein IPN69_15200 [Acidobacteria bacterium]|nr:hypothetical protein [Acidobacteriota bacterium]
MTIGNRRRNSLLRSFNTGLMIAFTVQLLATILTSAQPRLSKPTPYCSLFDSGIKSRNVVTEALLNDPGSGSAAFLYSAACNGPDNFSSVQFAENLSRPTGRGQIFRIRFKARFDVEPIAVFGELAAFRSRAKVMRIYSIEPVDPLPAPPDLKAPRPIIELGAMVKEMSARLVFEIRTQKSVKIGDINVPIRSLSIAEGRRKELPPGDRRVTWCSFSRAASRWMVKGKLNIADPSKSLDYDFVIVWSVSGDNWAVDSIRFKSVGRNGC